MKTVKDLKSSILYNIVDALSEDRGSIDKETMAALQEAVDEAFEEALSSIATEEEGE